MKRVYMQYNPFLVETVITIDGNSVSRGGELEAMRYTRLQTWLENLFPILEKECNDHIELTFWGTELDFEDVVAAKEAYEHECDLKGGGMQITLAEPIIVPGGIDRLKSLIELFDELQKDCPFEDLRTKDIKSNFARAIASTFEVSVIATMSSGKSTLINALLGFELVPSKNEACTATIARITDDDTMNKFTAECFDENSNLVARTDDLTAKIMTEFNDNERISNIEIKGDIPFAASDNMQLVLVDTPGPNNSRNIEHQRRTFRIIKDDKKMPMIIYVMDATKLFVNDDETLLRAVAEAVRTQHGQQAKDRFIFIINKADMLDTQKGDSVEGAIRQTQAYLKDHGIEDANIYPVSAEYAKLIRMHNAGAELSDDQDINYMIAPRRFKSEEKHLERYAPLSPANRAKINAQLEAARVAGDVYAETLVHTGIPAVEAAIVEYMEKYALTNKIKEAVDSFRSKIEEKDLMSKFAQELSQNEEERKRVSAQWENISRQVQQGQQAQGFRKRINRLDTSKEFTKAMRAVRVKLDNSFDAKKKKYLSVGNEIAPEQLRSLLHEIEQMIPPMQNDLQTDIEKIVNDSIVNAANKLMDEYIQSVAGLMGDPRFDRMSASSIKLLTVNLPNVDDMIERYTTTKTETVQVGTNEVGEWFPDGWHFYNPFSWYETREEPVFEDRYYDVAEGEAAIEDFFMEPRLEMSRNVDKIEAEAQAQVKDFKEHFVRELDRLDQAVQAKAKEMANVSRSREELISKVNSDKEKIKWLENFQAKLAGIIEIGSVG